MMRGGRLFLLQEKDNNHSDHSYNSETKKKSEPANADCHITSYVGPASRFLQSRPERLLVAPIHEPLPTFLRSSLAFRPSNSQTTQTCSGMAIVSTPRVKLSRSIRIVGTVRRMRLRRIEEVK